MIVHSERTDWINEYDYNQGYTWKKMTMRLSGHLWSGSAMETDDSCGNCDGARCDSCRKVWDVHKWGKPKPYIDPETGWHLWNYQDKLEHRSFFNREEAEAYYDSLTL